MGLKSSFNKPTGYAGQLIKNTKDGGKLDYLRTRQNHGRQVILMRMLLPGDSGGVNYHELVPRKSVDGKIRTVDIYIYLNAEFLSETIRRGLLPVVANLSRTFLDKLLTSERDYIKDLPKLPAIKSLIIEGKSNEALARLKELGPDTKKEKTILMLRFRAAQAVSEKEYVDVLEDFRKLYPYDPCIDMLSIDYYTLKNEFPKVIASVDRLDKAVGGDPYLEISRTGLSELDNDLTAALKFGKRAIEEDPTMLTAYWYVISVAMRAQKYDETLAILKKQDQAFKMNYKDLKTVPEYAGFVNSPQYQQWVQYLASKNSAKSPAPAKKSRLTKSKRGSRN